MDLQHSLWWLSIAAECAALLSLLLRGTARSYPWFTAYLAFGVSRDVGLHFAGDPYRSRTYALSWMITAPVVLFLLVMTAAEIIGKVPSHYQRFGGFGRQRLRRLLDAAIAVAVLSSSIEAGAHWTFSTRDWLTFVFTLNRITTTMLALYLIFAAVFVSRMRVPFCRNLLVHSRLIAVYLGLHTAIMFWQNMIAGGVGTRASNLLLEGGSAALFLLWAALITPAGETMPSRRTLDEDAIRENRDREQSLRDAGQRYSGDPL